MKLLIAADIFPPESGGPATYSVTLANELTKLGVEVKIVSLNPNSDVSVVTCPVFSVHYKNKLLRYAEYFWLLFKHAKDVDVVYAMGPVNAGLPALKASRLRRKKFVVKVVGDYAWEQGAVRFGVTTSIDEFQKQKKGFNFVGLLRRIEAWVVRYADQVITPAHYLKKMVMGWGVKEQKITVVYNAVEFKDMEPKVHKGERWLVSVSRLLPWKGMDALIGVMTRLSKIDKYNDVRLKIIGDGPQMDSLKKQVIEGNIASRVELVGNKNRIETLSYIHGADLILLNSGYEGLSHFLLEALSFNRPILASNCGGNSEIIIKNETGLLFDFNDSKGIEDKIKQFLDGSVKISNNLLRSNERIRFFKQFTVQTMISETRELLEKVCN